MTIAKCDSAPCDASATRESMLGETSCILGLRAHWRQAGQGQAVLLLHGWGSDSGAMWPLAAALAEDDFAVTALDLPGFGESEEPPMPWSAGDYARFVGAVMDALSISRAHIIGHSFGGSVGIVLAAEGAARVGKLALLNSAGVRRPPAWPLRWRSAGMRAARGGLRRLGLSDAAARLSEWSAARYGSADYRAAQGVMRGTLVRVLAEDLTAQAARVQAPTLLLWGERDEATPRWQGELLARVIPDAGLHVFPGAGHYAFLERLSETRHILRYFLKETG